ncbi:transposase [Vibrio sp. MEBiC08052]|nr:transposase [Vibrio sp. MEBiC08052]
MLGRKMMETEILKEALEIAQSKKLISPMPLLPPDNSLSSE